MKYDYSLYLVTDRRYKNGRNLEEAVEQAIMGGLQHGPAAGKYDTVIRILL